MLSVEGVIVVGVYIVKVNEGGVVVVGGFEVGDIVIEFNGVLIISVSDLIV